MKIDFRRLIRPLIAGMGVIVIFSVAAWVGNPSRHQRTGPLQPDTAVRAEAGNPSPVSDLLQGFPDVNPAAFKDQGDLAFVWQDLLYILDGKTGEVRQITGAGRALHPAWSYDGEWLAFIQAADPQAMTGPLWLVRRDGTQAHQVQGLPGPVSLKYFLWSPTACVLAVGGQNGLWLVPAEGAPRRLAPEDVAEGRPAPPAGVCSFAWSPDGRALAYNITLPYDDPQGRSDALYTVDVDGGQPVERIVTPGAGIQLAAWWPDGKGILYWLDPLHSASLAADGMGLYSLRLGDTEPKLLASGLARPGWLSFSPQGRLLMVAGNGRIVWARKSLAVINAESGTVQEIQNPAGCVALDPSFSPDGSRIAFVAAKNLGGGVWGFNKPEELAEWVATRTLWVENADGSGAHLLTSAGTGVYQPAWSKDGTRILYVRDNSLWITGIDGGQPEKVLGPFPAKEELFGFYGFVAYGNFAWFRR